MRHYKITKPESLAALKQFYADVDALQKASREFAQLIAPDRAKPWFTSGPTRSFAGLSFDPPMTGPEWTKPERQTRVQRPRTKVAADARPALAKLQELWASEPEQKVMLDPVMQTFGFSWGFFHGYSFFEHDGAIYFRTSDTQTIEGAEILGSEWDAAEAAHTASEQAKSA